jgi:hypothetical protein
MNECPQIREGCAHAFKELTAQAIIHTEQLSEVRDDQKEVMRLLRGNGRDGLETRVTRLESEKMGCSEGSDKTWKKISIGMGLVALLIAILA